MTWKPTAVLVVLLAASFTGCLGSGDDGIDPETILPHVGPRDRPQEERGTAQKPPTGFTDTAVFTGNYTTEGPYSRTLQDGRVEARSMEFVDLTSDVDGASIQIGLVRPDTPTGYRSPVVLAASVYYHQQAAPGNDQGARESYQDNVFTRFLTENLVPHGYTVALLAARGTAGSGGCNDALGAQARADLEQAIGWLANQSWSNARVGMFGFSTDATLTWNAAATGHPALETIVPANGWPDSFTRLQRNGTWSLTGELNPPAKTAGGLVNTPLPGGPEDAPDYLERVSCTRTATAGQASAWKAATGSDDDPAGYWDEHDVRSEILKSYNGSAFLVHGFQDATVPPHNAYPWATSLVEAGIQVKQLYGQWAHETPDQTDDRDFPTSVRWDFAEVLLHWYDHWLKPNVTRDLGPRVQVQDTQGQWRSEDAWPPTRATTRALYLTPDRALAPNASSATGNALLGPAPHQFLYGPNTSKADPEAECPGCAVFETEAMDEPIRFAGSPRISLTVTPTAPSGSISAHLYVVDEGADYLTGGQLDLRNPDAAGPPETPVPGQPTTVDLLLEPVDTVVPNGSHLALVLAQGSWHHVEDATLSEGLAPGGYGGGGVGSQGAVRVELGEGQSTLALQTLDIPEEAFFEPPGVS